MTIAPALLLPPPWLRTVRHTIDIGTSYDAFRSVLGLGIVLRAPGPHAGRVLEKHAEAWSRLPDGTEDMFAVLRALEIAQERGLRMIRIRWANNAPRRRMKEEQRAGARDGSGLRGAVLRLASTFEVVQFAYVMRRKNQNAKGLARMALESDALREEHPIFESVPARERRRAVLLRGREYWEAENGHAWEADDMPAIIEQDDDDDREIPF
jgi:Reverse transcriptase-like